MRVEVASDGKSVMLRDLPRQAVPAVRHWFGNGHEPVIGDDGRATVKLDPSRVLAFRSFNPATTIAPEVSAGIEQMLRTVPDRIRKHLHEHPTWGNLQSRLVTRAVERKKHIIGAYAGVGKTACIMEASRLVTPSLIVVPSMIWHSAYREDAKWFGKGLKIVGTHGCTPRERTAMLRQRADIYAVSPGCLHSSLADLIHLPVANVCVDESDPFSSHNSQRTRALFEITRDRELVSIWTANAAPNNLSEFYALANIVAPGKLGNSYGQFLATYASGVDKGSPSFDDPDLVRAALAAIRTNITLVQAEDYWTNRPKLKFIRQDVELGLRERAAYDSLRMQKELRLEPRGAKLEGDALSGEGIGGWQRLREVTAGFIYDSRHQPRFIGEGTKARDVVRFAKSVGEPFVVWCQFRAEQDLLVNRLEGAGFRCASITGTNRASHTALKRWQAGKLDILLSNPQSAAHGVRMNRARYCVFTGTPPNYAHVYQAIRRLWRWPQTQDVYAVFLVATGTVDEGDYASMLDRHHWNEEYRRLLRAA